MVKRKEIYGGKGLALIDEVERLPGSLLAR
jgi:hypothetical protein